MKKTNRIVIVLLSFSILFNFSCKKDKNNDGISLGDGCNASWKVDGVDYSEDNMAGCLYLDNTLNLSTNLTGGDFFLQVDPITSTGNYVANPNDQNLSVVVLLRLNDGTQIGINNGSVNVTELSNSRAKGTFSGDFYDLSDINIDPVFSVTNGSFEANF